MNYEAKRKALGLTQFDVAKAVGVSINTYIRWEKKVSNPNLENQKKIEEVLGIQTKKQKLKEGSK